MTFKLFVAVWVVFLVAAGIGLKSKSRPLDNAAAERATVERKAERQRQEAIKMQEWLNGPTWRFCDIFREELSEMIDKPAKCLGDDDPAYKSTRRAVEDAIRNR